MHNLARISVLTPLLAVFSFANCEFSPLMLWGSSTDTDLFIDNFRIDLILPPFPTGATNSGIVSTWPALVTTNDIYLLGVSGWSAQQTGDCGAAGGSWCVMPWINDCSSGNQTCTGKPGYPLVDAPVARVVTWKVQYNTTTQETLQTYYLGDKLVSTMASESGFLRNIMIAMEGEDGFEGILGAHSKYIPELSYGSFHSQPTDYTNLQVTFNKPMLTPDSYFSYNGRHSNPWSVDGGLGYEWGIDWVEVAEYNFTVVD